MAASAFMSWVATENFLSVERLLHDPTAGAASQIKVLGYEQTRQLLRYQVSEQNRFYLSNWEVAELVMGLALFGVLLFGTDVGKYSLTLPLIMLLLVALAHWLITPRMVSLGRALDYMPSTAGAREEAGFSTLHRAYGVVEVAKLVLGLLLAGILAWRPLTRRKVRENLDLVDHSHHRRVNR